MKFPDNLLAPGQQFSGAIERYEDKANLRLSNARNFAEQQTAQNRARKEDGIATMGMSGQLFVGFMAIMFLYLFVALERHHRSLRVLISKAEK